MPTTVNVLPQYLTTLCATLGSMGAGSIMGYSSPAGILLTNPNSNSTIHLTYSQNGWFSSISNLGAMVGCPLAGLCVNYFGRRGTLMYSVIPVTIGWILIAAGQNFAMVLIGRFITGLYCSLVSLAIPTYVAEFSSPRIRGTLGGGYELMIFVGMLFANSMGVPFKDFRWIGLACALIPCLCSFLMFFCKESPFYLLAYGKEKEAEDALRFFRGKKYDGIDAEMKIIRESLEERMSRKAKFSDLMIPYNLKPFLMALGLMILQQFLGINAVTFNLASIFEKAGSKLSPTLSSIIIEVTQVSGILVGSSLMDKAGRKKLLIISISFMIVSITALGLFFYFQEYNPALAEEIYWLPLISLVMYVVAYAIGSGPIPWLMMGELFCPEIKELAGSIVTLSNWTSAFVTTLMFQPLRTAMHDYGVYWMFCGFCFVKLFFVITFVYETKKKTLQEINAHFGKPPSVKVKDPKEEIFNSRL